MGMGEQKLRFKASKQTTEEGTEQDVSVETALVYECVRQPSDLQIPKGTKVRLLDLENEILVFRGTQNIGYVAPGQDDALRADVGLAQRKGRSIRGLVVDVSDITPSFFVKVKGYPIEKKQAIAQFFDRLDPLREIRNHIAHGVLRIALAEDHKTPVLALSLPKELDGSNSPDSQHLTHQDLSSATTALTDLIENFQNLFGNWVVDAEIPSKT